MTHEGMKNNAEKNLANHKEPLLDYTRKDIVTGKQIGRAHV